MYIDGLGKPPGPGRRRATYLFAHARDGMFLPIFEQSQDQQRPAKMLGMIVQVYTSDDQLYLYEIDKVRRHQLTLDAAVRRRQRRSSGSRRPRVRRARPARRSSSPLPLSAAPPTPRTRTRRRTRQLRLSARRPPHPAVGA